MFLINTRVKEGIKKGLAKIGFGKSKEYKFLEAIYDKRSVPSSYFKTGEELESENLVEKQKSNYIEGDEISREYRLTGSGKIYFHNLQKEYKQKRKRQKAT